MSPQRPDPFSLAGKVALLTGAGRGLGFEMAKAMGAAGAILYITGRNPSATHDAATRLGALGFRATALVCANEDEEAMQRALADVGERDGRIDILVNNVGARLRAPIEEIDGAAFRRLLDTDLASAYTVSREAVRRMPPGGRILMISSIQGMLGRRGDVAYATAKGGMIALTRALACEFADLGINCNAIAAGGFITETNRAYMDRPEIRDRVRERAPLRRYGEPHEIGAAAVFLASPGASFVTGAILVVDGGWSAAI